MHIKKLEIAGFKSFVDRTTIHFDHDVIAVVGPNGCGKSNIVDAIRWCMGEQSAKHLRGKSMEDVIFNGSETRAPHGLAEVTLTFDNSDPEQAATLPIEYRDYPEIAVTRRLSRDGTSDYLLNKVEVRLKDVVDVFLGTGVGTKAYSIVEQGRIGLIVSARAEDRRSLIEEAAGITKYKARKKASERKMELTEQNLLRVGDRVLELERSVSSLQRQAAKAERYVSYKSELETLVLHAASHELLDITAREKFAASERDQAGLEAEQARAELDASDAILESKRAETYLLEEEAERAQRDAFAADNEVRALEGEIARATDRLQHLDQRMSASERERGALSDSFVALQSERAVLAEALADLEAKQASLSFDAIAEQEKLESLRAEERAADTALAELNLRASQASSQIAAAEAKLHGAERRTADMLVRRDKVSLESQTIATERTSLFEKRDELESQISGLDEHRSQAATERTTIEAELAELRAKSRDGEQTIESAQQDLAHRRARLRALEELHDRLDGVGEGVRNLVATKDPTLLGLVVDRVQAPPDLATALASLLGDALECVVVADAERGVELLGQLRAGEKGRATVIPRAPRRVVAKARDELSGDGILGAIIDRLTFLPEDEQLVLSLVGDAVLVESAAAALKYAPVANGRALVALDGTVVHADGRISGGSGDGAGRALLEQQQEMQVLHSTIAERTSFVEGAVQGHRELRERMVEIGQALDAARQRAHEAELLLVTTSKDHRRADEQISAHVQRAEALSRELTELEALLVEAGSERAEAERQLEEGTGIANELRGTIEETTSRVADWREQTASQLAVVTDYKVRLAGVREQVASSANAVERLERSIAEVETRLARLRDDALEAAAQSGETAALLMATREALGEAVDRARACESALAAARGTFDAARAALVEGEMSLKGLRARVERASELLASHELSLQKLLIEKEHLYAGIRDRFRGLDLGRVVGDYHLLPPPDEAHGSRVNELSGLIERMGPVNLDATREHAEEKARLVFFVEQKADLEKALDDLRRAIMQMNRESRRRFAETFEAVNSRFKLLFPKMFRGGKAELLLTNPEDLLETGIEIVAQPPGKKLANIELMSGGEKALTAVSLIFAIFQYKPSPFCILDEVDAPLDEANVARYNELIRDMTDGSQFILITHVKKTMQSADVLYGVTMQEAGISRIVSVRINDAAQLRSGSAAPAAASERPAAVA